MCSLFVYMCIIILHYFWQVVSTLLIQLPSERIKEFAETSVCLKPFTLYPTDQSVKYVVRNECRNHVWNDKIVLLTAYSSETRQSIRIQTNRPTTMKLGRTLVGATSRLRPTDNWVLGPTTWCLSISKTNFGVFEGALGGERARRVLFSGEFHSKNIEKHREWNSANRKHVLNQR